MIIITINNTSIANSIIVTIITIIIIVTIITVVCHYIPIGRDTVIIRTIQNLQHNYLTRYWIHMKIWCFAGFVKAFSKTQIFEGREWPEVEKMSFPFCQSEIKGHCYRASILLCKDVFR